MEPSLIDKKTKELLKTLEGVGLTHAIIEGRNDDFIEEDELYSAMLPASQLTTIQKKQPINNQIGEPR